ncbi:PAS domain-containing protein [Rubellimicrobium aerolatum]|uniref:PAS domain-containing protein n=1 Tax=Rubellimicrobium aerolatum TaxID=490979 RepID=A0ABW0S8A5_9RHOB|nr:PAS domain-containing protein [Rubellimicrobium aerolatum]MBP1804302.1 hypothetical protein [Rubellimicrobium aerolatum]
MSRDDQPSDLLANLGPTGQRPLSPLFRKVPEGRAAMTLLESYWRELGGDRRPPRRRDLDASRIESALPHAFLLERIAPGIARFRIGGQELCNLAGLELAGLPISSLFAGPGRQRLRVWLDRCFDDPALVDLPVSGWRGVLQPPLTGRLLLLPLADREGRVTRAVGGLFLDRPSRLSRVRLDILEDETLRIEKVGPPAPPIPAVPAAAGPARSARPYLRLVVSND